jgi:sulfate permease, SulP family
MGWTGLGMLIKFIPYPVIAGFTSGVALILITTEVKDFFGLNVAAHGTVVASWITYAGALQTMNWFSAAIGLGTILIIIFLGRILPRIPASIVALLVATIVVHVFALPVETIGSRFTIPRGIPVPAIPHFSFDLLREMVEPATAIALLAAIEALLAAVVGEGLTGMSHDPNRVLIGQGIGNIASAFFGCLPATAAIARTATNVRNGARTPVAGLTHSLLLLMVLVFLGRWASLIPLACLAGILMYVAAHLLDVRGLAGLMKNPKTDVAVLAATLGLTVFVDLKTGVLIGVMLAAALFVHSMSSATHVSVVTREFAAEKQPGDAVSPAHTLPPGVEVYEINGPFFFGAVHKLKEVLTAVSRKPKVRILRMARVNVMDSTGLRALEDIHRLCRKQHAEFIIAEIHAQPFTTLLKSGLLERFGEKNVLASFDEALRRTDEILHQEAEKERA